MHENHWMTPPSLHSDSGNEQPLWNSWWTYIHCPHSIWIHAGQIELDGPTITISTQIGLHYYFPWMRRPHPRQNHCWHVIRCFLAWSIVHIHFACAKLKWLSSVMQWKRKSSQDYFNVYRLRNLLLQYIHSNPSPLQSGTAAMLVLHILWW
jgi:hypothetical protein